MPASSANCRAASPFTDAPSTRSRRRPRVGGDSHRRRLAGPRATDGALHTITAGQPGAHEARLLDAEQIGRPDRVLDELRLDSPAPGPDTGLDSRHDALLPLQEFDRRERRLALPVTDDRSVTTTDHARLGVDLDDQTRRTEPGRQPLDLRWWDEHLDRFRRRRWTSRRWLASHRFDRTCSSRHTPVSGSTRSSNSSPSGPEAARTDAHDRPDRNTTRRRVPHDQPCSATLFEARSGRPPAWPIASRARSCLRDHV